MISFRPSSAQASFELDALARAELIELAGVEELISRTRR